MNARESILRIKQESLRILKLQGYHLSDAEAEILNPNTTINTLYKSFAYKPALVSIFQDLNLIPKDGRAFLDDDQYRILQSAIYSKTGTYVKDGLTYNISDYQPSDQHTEPPNSDRVCVFFARSNYGKDVSAEEVRICCSLMIKYGCANGILITETKLHSNAAAIANGIVDNDNFNTSCFSSSVTGNIRSHNIQHFMDDELLYTPSDGIYAGRYQLLSEEENRLFVEKNGLEASQLIKVSSTDIIIKRLGVRPKDIVKITRKSTIGGTLIEEDIVFAMVYILPTEKKKVIKRAPQ